uniref:COBRA-like extracellular glycosyl-phosphatidyl inositol-anchored protein family n=1 Tax=Panagrellus redivivus TaxID=6233 RepID=A0A7E4V1D9_PANRE
MTVEWDRKAAAVKGYAWQLSCGGSIGDGPSMVVVDTVSIAVTYPPNSHPNPQCCANSTKLAKCDVQKTTTDETNNKKWGLQTGGPVVYVPTKKRRSCAGIRFPEMKKVPGTDFVCCEDRTFVESSSDLESELTVFA